MSVLLAERGLPKGQRMGIDATTLEASAAMRSTVRRDTGARKTDTFSQRTRVVADSGPGGVYSMRIF